MNWRGEEGIALVITLLVMTILFVMGTAFLSISSTETLIAINERNRVHAFHLAEAGAERAIAELNASGAYMGTTGEQSLGFGTYTTAVTNLGAAPGVVDPKQIVSLGYVPNGGVPNRAMAQVEVSVQRGSPFQFALFGLSLTELGETQVDSYDSTGGVLYDPGAAGSEGNIRSNGDIKLWSDNIVNGNAEAVNNINEVGSGNVITGTTTTGVSPVSVVPITDITFPPCTNAGGIGPGTAFTFDAGTCDLTVLAGETVTLDQGSHSFNKITLEAGAKVAVGGPVEIYVTGQFYAWDGAVINTSKIPTNLMLFSSYTGTDGAGTDAMIMDKGPLGGGEFYGGIYAPNSEVEFQDAVPGWQIYGAIVGKHIDIEDGARFHYDVALTQSPSPAGKFRPTAGSWREVFP